MNEHLKYRREKFEVTTEGINDSTYGNQLRIEITTNGFQYTRLDYTLGEAKAIADSIYAKLADLEKCGIK